MSDNRTDLPSPSAPNFQQRLRETVQTYLGKQGNPLDRGLTLRDLLENGIVSLKKGFTLRPGQSGTLPLNPGSAVVDAYEPDLTPPPVPTGLKAAAAISHVMVEHDAPLYSQGHGHLRTRLYGATRGAGAPAPVFSDAVEIAQFSGAIYSHPSNPATTWYFWAKWETVDGVLSPAPAGGTNGIVATTGQDVALLLDALTGEIAESQLYQGLAARINLIDDPDTTVNSVAARILTEAQARQAAITAEAATRQTADSSLAQEVATLTATINAADTTLSAAIQGEATARANADTAEAQARETLAARVTGAEWAISSQAAQISNRYTKAETDSAISSSSQVLSAAYQAADAATLESAKSYANAGILSEQTARANADSALASDITNLGATVNTNNATLSAAIQTEATARADADAAVSRSVSTLQASAGTGGLVYNGSFANGSAEGWAGLAGVSSAPYGGLPKAYAGIQTTRDIHFPNADPSQWMACRPGDEFEVSAWVSAQAVSPRYGVGIQYEETSGNIGTWTILDTATAPTTAKFLRGYWTAPSAARRVRFWGQIDTFGTENPWHITDVQLRRTDARTGANTAAIQTEAEVRATQTGELYAKYGVKLDVNGYVTGWAVNNNGSAGDMIVLADRFAVGAPGAGNIIPFTVNTNWQTINGVNVPPGTYMDAAYVKNGTITNAKIADLAVDDAKITNLSVGKLTAGSLSVGEWIASSDFVSGQQGWAIWGNGHAELGAACIRGQLAASQINTEGLTIKQNGQVILGAGVLLPAQFVTPDGGWLNINLIPSINAAATTANWGGVSGKPKTFTVRAYGNGYSAPPGWWNGLRNVDTEAVVAGSQRSYTMMDFDRAGNPVHIGYYDVYGVGEIGGKTGQNLADDLNYIATYRKGNIVVVFTADEPFLNRMSYGLPEAMYRCGASKAIFGSSSFRFHGAYILVGVAGCGEGNGAEIYAGTVNTDPNSWCELTFSIQNGSLNVSGMTGSPKSVRDFDYTGALDANNTYLSGGAIYGVSGEPGTSVSNGLIGINASGELYGAGAGNGIKISNNQVYISDGSIYGIGGGAGTKIDNSYQAIGQNLIPNSDQTHTPCFGGLYNPNSAMIEHVNSYASDRWGVDNYVISGSTTRNLSARQLGVASGGDSGIAFDTYPTGGWGRDFGIPVVAGTRYMFSCYFASHRCRFNIGIGFWDAAGNSISYAEGVAAGPTESAANSLERYIRVSVAAVAPSGAVTVTAHIRKYNSFSWAGDSYIWYAAPMLEAVSANATEPSPYMPGPAGNTRQLGYVGDLNATVGAPAGTYVGSTPAQNVESQAGAQARADAAANWAVSTAQTYAAAKADLARINAEAHADGQVSAAEQRAIADASNKAEAARVAAVNAAAADATAKANVAATTANWSGVAQRPMDISNLIRKGVFDDGHPGTWTHAGIENRINGGMPYAKNIYFHTRDNLENGSDFPVTPGETIYAAAWFETQGITDYPCYLGLRVSDAFGNVVQWLAIAGISPNTGWRYVTGSGVIAANAASAAPWVQMAGFDFPANYQWLRASGLWLGRHAPGATVGAPAGTYVGDTLAQNVESQSGAQYRADVARAGAIGVASEDASAKANWARNAAVGDVTPSINAKLNKAGDTISGRISFAVADGMFAGSDTNNGVYFGKDGLVGRKGGANTFYINTAGDAVFSGSIDAATMNSGVINLQHNGGWDWGYVRSNGKWWTDGQNGWVLARHADGSTFMEMRGGSNRFWMSSWNDCGIQFPGISMTNGGLTISQANVIDTLQLAGNAVTVSNQAAGTARSVSTTLTIPANTTMAITAVGSVESFISEDSAFYNWSVPMMSISIDGVGISDAHQYRVLAEGENWTDYTIYATSLSYGRSITNSSASPITVTITVTGALESVGASKSITAFGFKR